MPKSFNVNQNNEFFIAIAKSGIHSFVMLGVMQEEKPILLAKVGKSNLIDKSFGSTPVSQCTMFGKAIGSHTDAFLMDEGISTQNIFSSNISYQAYGINFQQYLEFLIMIKGIHEHQLIHYQDREEHPGESYHNLNFPEKGVRKLRSGIMCYIPASDIAGEDTPITLQYKNVDSFQHHKIRTNAECQEIIYDAAEIKLSNTCRTTAKALLNYILGYNANSELKIKH